jgi:hypothetical protein
VPISGLRYRDTLLHFVVLSTDSKAELSDGGMRRAYYYYSLPTVPYNVCYADTADTIPHGVIKMGTKRRPTDRIRVRQNNKRDIASTDR